MIPSDPRWLALFDGATSWGGGGSRWVRLVADLWTAWIRLSDPVAFEEGDG